jgi:oligosaccharide repeat unit polymerase
MYSDSNLYSSGRLSGFAVFLSFAIITYIVSIVTNFASMPDLRRIGLFPIGRNLSILFVINSIILIGTFLLSGYRSNAIQIIIPIVLAYQIKYRPIKPILVLIILLSGSLIMFFIGMTRSGNDFNASSYTTLTYLRDFKPANAANTYLINYVDTSGPTGGSNMLFPILSIIPGLQFIINLFININTLAPVSSKFFTVSFNSDSGFGTNIIGDIYYSFGFLGVVVLMFIYGCFLRRFTNAKNNYELVMFLVFSGNAMFAPRVEYCYIIRSIAWSVIFLFLIRFISKKA